MVDVWSLHLVARSLSRAWWSACRQESYQLLVELLAWTVMMSVADRGPYTNVSVYINSEVPLKNPKDKS